MAIWNAKGWNDDLLIREIRAGGKRRELAWHYIVRDWRRYYLAPVLQAGGTGEAVNLVLHRVVLDVEKQIRKPEFRLHSASLKTYFTESVFRAWKRAQGKSKPPTVEFDPKRHGEGTDDGSDEDPRLARLDALLERLGEPCKTVLTLYREGYSMREIAQHMNYGNEQTAKNKKRDCYERLLGLAGQ